MKKILKGNLKRWIAFLLAVVLIATTCVYSSDAFLRAEGDETQAENQAEPASEEVEVIPTEVDEPEQDPEPEAEESNEEETEEETEEEPVEEDVVEIPAEAPEEPDVNPEETTTPEVLPESPETTPDQPADPSVSPAIDPSASPSVSPSAVPSASPEKEEGEVYSYTICYYYDGVEDEDARVEKEDGVLNESIIDASSVKAKVIHNGENYELDKIENEDGVVTEDSEKNVVSIYYALLEEEEDPEGKYSYEIRFHFDGVEDTSVRIEKENGVLGNQILDSDSVEEKVTHNKKSYVLDTIKNKNGKITEDETANVVNVYYVLEKESKLEQTLTATADDGAKIKVVGKLPEGAQVKVETVSVTSSAWDAVEKSAKEDGKELVELKLYDITIWDADGNEIQPDDTVKVTITGAGVKNGDAAVYHVEDGNAEKVADVASGNNAQFDAEHFSVYGVGISVLAEEDKDGGLDKKIKLSKTSDKERNEGVECPEYSVGETITYYINVENTSQNNAFKELSNVVIEDTFNGNGELVYVSADKLDVKYEDGCFIIDKLSNGAENSIWITCEYVVVEEDAGKTLTNTIDCTNKEITVEEGPASANVKIEETYTVNYNLDGGSSTSEKLEYFGLKKGDSTPKINEPTKDGYSFMGWTPEIDECVTKNVTYTAKWSKDEYKVTYQWAGDTPEPVKNKYKVPIDNATYGYGDSFTADAKQYSAVETTDSYGNVNGKYVFQGWTPASGEIEGNTTIVGTWVYEAIPVADHGVTYSWGENAPVAGAEGVYAKDAVTLPTDNRRYVEGQEYTVDPTYGKGHTVNSHDEYGNVNGTYVFSGWSPEAGAHKMGDTDVTVEGTWTYTAQTVEVHNVSYDWGTLPGGLYDRAGKEVTPALPETIGGIVKGQSYAGQVDKTYTSGTVYYTHDGYGNVNGSYTFSGWTVPDNGVMGEEDVTVTGSWTAETIEVPKFRVNYTFSGNIPDEAVALLPRSEEYFLNQPVTVAGTPSISGYIFSGWTATADSNVSIGNGTFTMPNNVVTITGSWTADFADISANPVVATYDGVVRSIVVEGVIEGDAVEYLIGSTSVENSFKDATRRDVTVKVTRGSEEKTVSVPVTISPRPVTVKSADLTEKYNGEYYTNPTILDENTIDWVESERGNIGYDFTGQQKLVGSSKNTFKVRSNSKDIKLTNYFITCEYGTLTVTDGDNTDRVLSDDVVTKAHDAGVYEAGSQVAFSIEVTNIYDKVQTITVEELPGVTFEGYGEDEREVVFENVEAGGKRIINAYYTVTVDDAFNGESFLNTVKVRFSDGKEFENSDEVTIEKLYRLRVNYLYGDGTTAAGSVERYYKAGAGYTIESPAITGYVYSQQFVTGTMPESNMEIWVYYAAIPEEPEPTTEPEPVTEPDDEEPDVSPVPPIPPTPPVTPEVPTPVAPPVPVPAGTIPVVLPVAPALVAVGDAPVPLQGALIETDDDGNVTVTPITEEEIPLANKEIDDHKCCIMSFLLMLATLIIYSWFTHSMKKRQKKLAELKDQLAEETLKRQLGITDKTSNRR